MTENQLLLLRDARLAYEIFNEKIMNMQSDFFSKAVTPTLSCLVTGDLHLKKKEEKTHRERTISALKNKLSIMTLSK